MLLVHETRNTIEMAMLQDNGKSQQDSKERNKTKNQKTSFLKVMNINVAKLAGLIYI